MAEYLFNEPHYKDPAAAREYLEGIRWPKGPVCPHCGAFDRITKLQGKSHRPGLYDCGHCRDQFTVTVGTVFERSKISLDKWLFAAALMASSKKGVSSKQVERMLGVTYKTAWFMTHRLREAMKAPGGMLGGGGNTVEVDETYWGNKPVYGQGKPGTSHKMKILSLVERGGNVRSFHIPNVTSKTLKPILTAQIAKDSRLMTDEWRAYKKIGYEFDKHDTVQHGRGEYVRGDAYTNTVEGFFSILKRGLIGTFHHVGEQHLQRYVTEFDFRYNHRETKVKVNGKWEKAGFSDAERTVALLKGISNKRLTYRRINAAA